MRSIRLVGFFGLAALAGCADARHPPTPRPSAPSQPPIAHAPPVDAASSASANACEGETFGLPDGASVGSALIEKKKGTMGVASRQMVATSHRLATEAGLGILRSGGNAADAFVAATLVQDVVLPGVTSTAGLTGVMVYEAKTGRLSYVHGGLADPIDPAARYRVADSAMGKHVLVPGAPAAYAEIVKRFGKRRLKDVVEPAARLAAEGFVVDALYAGTIAFRRETLARSAYGKKAFFHEDGKPIAEGETVKLADFAKTLRSFGDDPSWFYRGQWPRDAVKLVRDNGGALVQRDFETYAPEIGAPIHGRFMGNDVYAAGHGGAKLLVTLGAIEILRAGRSEDAPSASADVLERLLRVQRATNVLPLLHDRAFLARGAGTEADIEAAARDVAERAPRIANSSSPPSDGPGTHSSAVIVVDAQGNVVVGTHTIETMPWGEGLFVGGIPLSTAAATGFDDAVQAKTRVRMDPLTNTLVMKDGKVRAALAVYGTGLHLADAEILDAVIARGLDAEAAVLEPRVGYFQFDHASHRIDYARNAVDPRFDAKLLCTMKQRGFFLERSMPGYPPGVVDTGFPTLVTIAPGALHGMTPERMNGVAAGD